MWISCERAVQIGSPSVVAIAVATVIISIGPLVRTRSMVRTAVTSSPALSWRDHSKDWSA